MTVNAVWMIGVGLAIVLAARWLASTSLARVYRTNGGNGRDFAAPLRLIGVFVIVLGIALLAVNVAPSAAKWIVTLTVVVEIFLMIAITMCMRGARKMGRRRR